MDGLLSPPLSVEGFPLSAPLCAAAGYLVVIAGLRQTVASPWEVSPWVIAGHNAFIALWSLIMLLGALWHIAQGLQGGWGGIQHLYCDPIEGGEKGSYAPGELEGVYWWLWLYHVSKYYELLDTLIICIKQRSLIFLHYYHHAIILPVTWFWMCYRLRFTIIGMAFNTLVHVFMYTYFATAALAGWAGQNPKHDLTPYINYVNTVWKRNITRLQIFQFACSFILSVPFVYYATEFTPDGVALRCHGMWTFLLSAGMNASFLFMFVGFFDKTYNKGKKKQ
eukprot:Hpha_TRINITY_DN815_c0_g1::TRINITY_DN815_c0_g1_i1::g.195001::m.195001